MPFCSEARMTCFKTNKTKQNKKVSENLPIMTHESKGNFVNEQLQGTGCFGAVVNFAGCIGDGGLVCQQSQSLMEPGLLTPNRFQSVVGKGHLNNRQRHAAGMSKVKSKWWAEVEKNNQTEKEGKKKSSPPVWGIVIEMLGWGEFKSKGSAKGWITEVDFKHVFLLSDRAKVSKGLRNLEVVWGAHSQQSTIRLLQRQPAVTKKKQKENKFRCFAEKRECESGFRTGLEADQRPVTALSSR